MHLTLRRRRDVVARDGAHLATAGVRHDGAGGDGDAGDERKDEELKMAADVLPAGARRSAMWVFCFFSPPFKKMVVFMVESRMLSLSQAFHQEADVRFGHTGRRHAHDAALWLALQSERRLWEEQT